MNRDGNDDSFPVVRPIKVHVELLKITHTAAHKHYNLICINNNLCFDTVLNTSARQK